MTAADRRPVGEAGRGRTERRSGRRDATGTDATGERGGRPEGVGTFVYARPMHKSIRGSDTDFSLGDTHFTLQTGGVDMSDDDVTVEVEVEVEVDSTELEFDAEDEREVEAELEAEGLTIEVEANVERE
jgi:hypothetical protein